jgi:anti-anti-sigma factor
MTTEQKRRIFSLESKFSNLQVKHHTLQEGEILYRQNDNSDSFYLVLDGLIELGYEQQEGNFSARIKKDEIFGLKDILENKKRSETAVALNNAEVLKIQLLGTEKNQTAALYNELVKTKTAKGISTSNTDSTPGQNLYSIRKVTDNNIVSFLGPHGNLSNAVYFKDVLFMQINDGNKNLIIDLLACKTIDSTFMGTLIAALKKVSELEGSLKLVCGADLCSWLFLITKMDKVFKIYGSVEEAIAG